MVEIKPFKAVILNPELENRAEMVCPVYDTIDTSQYEKYSAKRNNVISFTTRKEGVSENEFVDFAKQDLNRFFNEGLLIEREKRSFYIYGVRYKLSEELLEQIPEEDRRETYFAFGLVALVKVEKLNEHSILGHEKTFDTNTQERYLLMRECGMIFSPIVAEYNMPNHDINRIFEDYLGFRRPDLKIYEHRKPIVDVELNGARHMLWEVSDEEIMGKIQHLMKNKRILILDGHHRYTASHRLSMDKEKGTAYTLMTLLEGGDRSLLLLPWHRCVKGCHIEDLWQKVKENFKIESYEKELDAIYSRLREHDHGNEFDVRLGMYDGDKVYLLRADEQKIRELAEERGERVGLDIISLHEWIIGKSEDLVYMSSLRDAIKKVDRGDYRVAFFLKPLRITDVEYKAQVEKKTFPQKSTLFLPKVAEGIVMCRNLI
jgi:uncharacterized protein (DUF1015 family)